jgi:dienelactone hydrolase
MRMSNQALAFARRGYAVAVVTRRGYGSSEGDDAEYTGGCGHRDYERSARVSGDDVLSSVRTLQREPWVDPRRLLLIGHSAGGLASLAAAAGRPSGLLGIVSFAGGRGSDGHDNVCQSDRLVTAMGELGRRVRAPSLWIYAANDHTFSQELSREMAVAYAAGGAPMEFLGIPAYGEDGHLLFSRGRVDQWWPLVAPFLTKLGLPTEIVHAVEPPPLRPAANMSSAARQAFEGYLAADTFEKAFAYGATWWGSVGSQPSTTEAQERALRSCREHSADCIVYAVNNSYAPGITEPPAVAPQAGAQAVQAAQQTQPAQAPPSVAH